MLSHVTLALLGLASTAAATYNPAALKSLHSLRREHVVVVEVRQADTTDLPSLDDLPTPTVNAACASSLASLASDAPTLGPDLESYFESYASTADPNDPSAACQATQVPASLSSEYSSYDKTASSWLTQHSSEIRALATQCSEFAAAITQVISSLDTPPASCGSASATGANGTSATGSPTGSNTANTSSSTTATPAGAARPTGFFAGAVAAAGVLGVAAVF